MRWPFQSDTVTLDKEAYASILREAADLRIDKKRLIEEVDSLKAELKASREDNAKLTAAVQRASVPITKELIAKRMGIPLGVIDHLDFDRMGIQIQDEPGKRH